MPNPYVPALVTFLHDLFTAAWIGGMISLGLVTLPALRGALGPGPQVQGLGQAIYRRLRVVARVSIVGLLVTGLLLSRRAPGWQGLFVAGNRYASALAAKHVVVVLMVIIALVRGLLMQRSAVQFDPERNRALGALLVINMVLGVVVLALSAYAATLASLPG